MHEKEVEDALFDIVSFEMAFIRDFRAFFRVLRGKSPLIFPSRVCFDAVLLHT